MPIFEHESNRQLMIDEGKQKGVSRAADREKSATSGPESNRKTYKWRETTSYFFVRKMLKHVHLI